MSFQKTPNGTRGGRGISSNPLTRTMMRLMTSWHRRSGDKFQGMDLLYLTVAAFVMITIATALFKRTL